MGVHPAGLRNRTGLSDSGSGAFQELGCGGRVEVEHPGTSELAVSDLIEAKDGAFESRPGCIEPSLLPEDDHLIGRGRHEAWVHPPFGVGGLEGIPDVLPSSAGCERGWPVKLGLGVEQLSLPSRIARLDRLCRPTIE